MTALPLSLGASLNFAALPAKVRDEVTFLDSLLKQVVAAPARMAAYQDAARRLQAAGMRGTVARVRSLVARYEASGCDWRSLIDKRRLPHDDEAMPAAFIQEVKRRFEKHNNSSRQAHIDLLAEWRAGRPIAGYATPPAADPYTHIPPGWSYPNLCRVCKSTPFELAAIRVGLGRAKALHGPKKFNSRAGLWTHSHRMWDDVEHDGFIHLLGGTKKQLCRSVDLGVLEVLSGDRFEYGNRPMTKRWDEKEGRFVKEKLKGENVRFLFAKVLLRHGFNMRGTVEVIERGTATFPEKIMQIVHDRMTELYGHAPITFDMGGWTGKEQAVSGMFEGRGGGNPRHKSNLEVLHRLIHTRLGALPGQTGNSVENRPEQLHGMLNESGLLLKIYDQLTEFQREKLRFPTLEYHTEFLPILGRMYDIIANRRDHELLDWADCNFMSSEYRFHRESLEWISREKYLALPDATQGALSQIVRTDTACERPYRMSPREARLRDQAELVRPPISLIAELLYDDMVESERKLRGSYFEIDNQELAPDTLVYESRVRTMDGREVELTAGEHYEVVVNPFDIDTLWVYTGKRGAGGFLGQARRADRPGRHDAEAQARALGRNEQRYKSLLAPLRERHAQTAREEAARKAACIDALSGPRTIEEAAMQADQAERGPASPEDVAAFVQATFPKPEPTPTDPTEDDGADLRDLI